MNQIRILDRGILEWTNLLLAVFNAIIIFVDIYNNRVNNWLLLNAFVVGLCFSAWLWGGMVNRKNDMVVRSMRVATRASNGWGESNKIVRQQNVEIRVLKDKAEYERKIKDRCSQRNKRRKR